MNVSQKDSLNKLNSGVDEWNAWRAKNPSLRIIFDGAITDVNKQLNDTDIKHIDFSGVEFRNYCFNLREISGTNFENAQMESCGFWNSIINKANFKGATLSKGVSHNIDIRDSDFSNVTMEEAAIFQSHIRRTKFNNSNLRNTNFQYSSFESCNFDKADLSRTGFRFASLHDCTVNEANMMQCGFGRTSIFNTDITRAINTIASDQCHQGIYHADESLLSLDLLTNPNLPSEILQGIGLNETFIDYLPSLSEQKAIQMESCFISYSHKDETFAKKLYGRLRDEGISVWYAPSDMQGGKKIPPQISKAISLHDRLLLILSDQSIESDWVKEEIYEALKKNENDSIDTLYPISILEDFESLKNWNYIDPDSGKNIPRIVREYFIPNFSNWHDENNFEIAFSKLIKSLAKS